MENTSSQHSETLPTGIFQLPGEPGIVVNGLPNEPEITKAIPLIVAPSIAAPSNPVDATLPEHPGFGVWLVGRGVRKVFEDRCYSGTVIGYDSENKWYRIEYEDGDSEDLEWHELAELLLPLDVTVSLKSLARKVVKISYPKGNGSKAKIVKTQGGSSSTQ